MVKSPNSETDILSVKDDSFSNEIADSTKSTKCTKSEETKDLSNSKCATTTKCKVNKQRCYNCGKYKRKKVRLILFDCRCDYKFCNECLLAENHNCDFDYKKKGKEILEKNNPKVDYEKIKQI